MGLCGNDRTPWPLSWVLFQALRREKVGCPHVGPKVKPAVGGILDFFGFFYRQNYKNIFTYSKTSDKSKNSCRSMGLYTAILLALERFEILSFFEEILGFFGNLSSPQCAAFFRSQIL